MESLKLFKDECDPAFDSGTAAFAPRPSTPTRKKVANAKDKAIVDRLEIARQRREAMMMRLREERAIKTKVRAEISERRAAEERRKLAWRKMETKSRIENGDAKAVRAAAEKVRKKPTVQSSIMYDGDQVLGASMSSVW